MCEAPILAGNAITPDVGFTYLAAFFRLDTDKDWG